MSEKQQTLLEALEQIIEETQEYADGLMPKMRQMLSTGEITTLTAQVHQVALDALKAAPVSLAKGDYHDALHFLTRACANLGEHMARASIDRKKS